MPRALASSSRAFVVDRCAGGHRHHHHRRVAATPRASRLRTRALDGHFETLRFLTPADVKRVAETHGTPTYVYDEASLEAQGEDGERVSNAYGLTVRYAMKASPNAAILKTFKKAGLNIDASSGYECERAMLAGFAGGGDFSVDARASDVFPGIGQARGQGERVFVGSVGSIRGAVSGRGDWRAI